MASTALPPAAPYAAVAKPWTEKPNPRARISYFLTYALVFVGAGLGAVQSYLTYRNVRLDRAPLCLVFQDDFDSGDDAAVFGTGSTPGRWLREAQLDGFGTGAFDMTTGSANNSFLQNGNLYIAPTLTPGWPFPDGTTYNETACTWNRTTENGGIMSNGEFDWSGYYAACSRTTNSTAGTIINPVQSARLSTLVSARAIRYGKVEVRAKMPVGDWLWPAIWMLPVNSTYGAWPRSGEIDIVESRGNGIRYTNRGANFVQGSLNWGPSPAFNGVGKSYSWWTERRETFSSGFHTYTLEWTSDWLRIYVDTRLHTLLDLKFNEPFWTRGEFPPTAIGPDGHPAPLDNPWANRTNAAPFDQDFYLIMNVAVGGTNGWFPDGQGDKPWLNAAGNAPLDFIRGSNQWMPTWPQNVEDRAMVVDYVKMWKHCGDP
ncbi:glycoside hydrolase family 16 protein [Mycena belliarum]|uniref:Glycoside hydrolase family 16 protein n=1 Tax=Mycena belliarum TaxID=1033014 RepID=A0AAD6TXF3_9AGAR|nr:glycoside hydrolase family 16 protein [Mycena belliae]